MLPGFLFNITKPGYLKQVVTENDGYYIINCLAYGNYTITEDVPAGWQVTSQNPVIFAINSPVLKEIGFGDKQVPASTTTTTTTGSTTTTLAQGFDNKISLTKDEWKLISVPKPLMPKNFSSVFEPDDVMLYYTGVWKFISESPLANNVEPLWGFWARSTANNETITLTYNTDHTLVPPSRHLTTGWNLIGHGNTAELPVHDALYSINGKYSFVLTYDHGWKLYNPLGSSDFTTMKPGVGYWVFMTQEGTLAGII